MKVDFDLQSLEHKADELLNSWTYRHGRMKLDMAFAEYADEYCRDPEYLVMTDKDELADYAFDFYLDNQLDFIEWLLGYDKEELNDLLNEEQGD